MGGAAVATRPSALMNACWRNRMLSAMFAWAIRTRAGNALSASPHQRLPEQGDHQIDQENPEHQAVVGHGVWVSQRLAHGAAPRRERDLVLARLPPHGPRLQQSLQVGRRGLRVAHDLPEVLTAQAYDLEARHRPHGRRPWRLKHQTDLTEDVTGSQGPQIDLPPVNHLADLGLTLGHDVEALGWVPLSHDHLAASKARSAGAAHQNIEDVRR